MCTNASVGSSPSNSSLRLPSACFTSQTSVFVFSAVSVTNLLLLFVFFLILCLGHRRRRRRQRGRGAAAPRSNLFAHHAIAMQLSETLGLSLWFSGGSAGLRLTMAVGQSLLIVASTGQALLHLLTCVEHYLAVVQPVAYLQLKRAGEVRVRSSLGAGVWLLSCGWLLVCFLGSDELSWAFYSCLIALYVFVVPFCSVSVLCALRRPGPGERRPKLRAFRTILAVMAVLLFKLVGNVGGNVLSSSAAVGADELCVVLMCITWLDVPSGLVLPLLLLHRERKPTASAK